MLGDTGPISAKSTRGPVIPAQNTMAVQRELRYIVAELLMIDYSTHDLLTEARHVWKGEIHVGYIS